MRVDKEGNKKELRFILATKNEGAYHPVLHGSLPWVAIGIVGFSRRE